MTQTKQINAFVITDKDEVFVVGSKEGRCLRLGLVERDLQRIGDLCGRGVKRNLNMTLPRCISIIN